MLIQLSVKSMEGFELGFGSYLCSPRSQIPFVNLHTHIYTDLNENKCLATCDRKSKSVSVYLGQTKIVTLDKNTIMLIWFCFLLTSNCLANINLTFLVFFFLINVLFCHCKESEKEFLCKTPFSGLS